MKSKCARVYAIKLESLCNKLIHALSLAIKYFFCKRY